MGGAASRGRPAVRAKLLSKGALNDRYELQDHVLGKGSFAVVHSALERDTGKLCACKVISKWQSVERKRAEAGKATGAPAKRREMIDPAFLNREVEILRKAGSHPNILEVYDVYGAASPMLEPD